MNFRRFGGDSEESWRSHWQTVARAGTVLEFMTPVHGGKQCSQPGTRRLRVFIVGSSMQFKDMPEEELDEHASHAAEYCWLTARSDLSSERLFKKDFEALLPDAQDAEFTFSLFDLDGDGCGSRRRCPEHVLRLPCLPSTKQHPSSSTVPRQRVLWCHTLLCSCLGWQPCPVRIVCRGHGCCVWLPLPSAASIAQMVTEAAHGERRAGGGV